jgi:hypothetical protein
MALVSGGEVYRKSTGVSGLGKSAGKKLAYASSTLMVFLCSPDNKPLREALDAPDGFLISRHRDYIERVVRSAHPHTVAFRDGHQSGTASIAERAWRRSD